MKNKRKKEWEKRKTRMAKPTWAHVSPLRKTG